MYCSSAIVIDGCSGLGALMLSLSPASETAFEVVGPKAYPCIVLLKIWIVSFDIKILYLRESKKLAHHKIHFLNQKGHYIQFYTLQL